MTHADPVPLPQVGSRHYEALCGLCLAVIFLVQLQVGLLLTNLLVVMVGGLGLAFEMRLGPTLLVIVVAGAHLSLQIRSRGYFAPGQYHGTMNLTDVLLCVAVLGYVAGHYRLQGIWHQILPTDAHSAGSARRVFPLLRKQVPVVEEKRLASQITPQEIAWLVATLPIWAVAAQLAGALLPRHWEALDIPYRVVRMLLALWLLAVGFLVVSTFLDIWKQRRRDRATAQLYLQDLLWRDTRGEQRRVNRWLAWWKLASK